MSNEQHSLKVFLCHAPGDSVAVRELYQRLVQDGMDVWFTEESLLPGLEREFEIPRAVRAADAVVVCLSRQFNQAGSQQKEARLALDTAMEQPEGEIFIIPAKLERCEVPESLKKYQRVDLFAKEGYEKLLGALKLDAKRKTPPVLASPVEASSEEKARPAEAEPQPRGRSLPNVEYMGVALFVVIGLLIGGYLWASRAGPAIFSDPPTATPTVAFPSTPTSTATGTSTPTNTPTLQPTFTFTPVPATDTPTVTPTITVVPPMQLGKDWLAGCISTFWRPYPATIPAMDRGNGCWNEPLHVFSAENGDLDFLAQRGRGATETFGLFAPLPERGTVTFTVRLRDLYNADLWMGVFAEPDIASPGLLMIIPNGDVRKRVIVQKDPHNYETILSTVFLEQGGGYSISFLFKPLSVESEVKPHTLVTNPLSLPSAQKWLFLGYRGYSGYYGVEGTFLQFELKP